MRCNSNNLFNIRAFEAGREWALAHPNASGVAVDEAATQHTPINPGRRHFQDAAHWTLEEQSHV